ncbi:DNA glycosylase AlkZ-like family protein [Gordonia sp. (in: high G+C Gram-positive bacteria)]|uniref:DNA glycosylase AlkZ-like family protein n=1 Tax=Gordonia sp. (in: high G+C Gram-positive bacteria) TaxID=84139 RepID=UPI0039E57A98
MTSPSTTWSRRCSKILPADSGDELDESDAVPGSAIRSGLAERWPDVPPEALAAVARAALPLVQVPPRGLWRRSGSPSYLLLDQWIGAGDVELDDEEARKDLIRMYLRGFGPATRGALTTWSGLSGMGALLDRMEADWELTKLAGPGDRELFDLEGLSIADGAVAAPVRFVAPYDNVLVANGDRDRLADTALYARTVTANGRSPGFVLVGGWLSATWRLDDGEVSLHALRDLSESERHDVEAEACRLRDFVAGADR